MKTKFLIPLIAGVGLFCACGKSKSGYEVVNNSNADSVKVDQVVTLQPKLVKKGSMRIKVKNVEQASNYITALTSSYHGMVIQHEMNASEEGRNNVRLNNDSVLRIITLDKNANIIVRIPTEKLDEFMDKIAGIGVYVNNRYMEVSDKSLDYLSSQLKLKNRTELVAQQKTGKIIIKNPANVLLLKDEMVDQQIANRSIDDEVKNTTISLNIYQSNIINKEVVANDDPFAYNLPFPQRLLMALQNGWTVFVDIVVGLANLWVFILIALGTWALVKLYRTKHITEVAKA
jgi:Domain of unknown function (DUF4349)